MERLGVGQEALGPGAGRLCRLGDRALGGGG